MSSASSSCSSSEVTGTVPCVARMVTVFDPVNKQPYEFVYGGESSEVTYTAGLETYFNQLGGNKRVFLCKKYQARQCRQQGKCNSIHADRRKVAKLRKEMPVSDEVKKSELTVEVWSEADNERFNVPLDRVTDLVDLNNPPTTGTLCPAACCRTKPCEFIHVEASYMRHLRSMWKMPCCGKTSCTGNAVPKYPMANGIMWENFKISEGGRGAVWHKTLLAPTKGLQEICDKGMFHDGCLHIPMNRVCRPHQRKNCKWDSECNNVHVCRVKMPPGNTRSKVKSPPPLSLPEVAVKPAAPSSNSVLTPLLEKFRLTYTGKQNDHIGSPLHFNASVIRGLVQCA
eukprot:TRINITY_DN917_c0_g1_i1.p1 TRINITY_DN917_c0_g1~~TRINITY_DN917_c0_g1_i1.p1  ORF type:complete len:341 (+),score=110.86 TRINITY_DN917_c0_g1_i1:104-1126(+)